VLTLIWVCKDVFLWNAYHMQNVKLQWKCLHCASCVVSVFVILFAQSYCLNLNFITDTEFRILDLKRKKEPVRKKSRKKPDVIPPR